VVFKAEDLILNFDRIRSDVTDFIRGNPLISAGVGLGAALSLAGIGTAVVSKLRKKKRKKSKKKTKKDGRRRKTGRKAGRRKRKRSGLTRATKQKIRFTKNGQPFVITRSGKARFIKKTTATRAKARKGGFT